jgi:hypothetical protein
MNELVEEANKKAADAAARLEEAEANLKVKDAELAEARVRRTLLKSMHDANVLFQTKSVNSPKTSKKPKGLAASRFAEDLEEAKPEAAEGEQYSSSAALASVRKPSPNSSIFFLAPFLPSLGVTRTRNTRRENSLTDNF